MSLQDALDQRRDASRERLPREALDAMDAGVTAVTASDLVGRALPVGARLPPFTLPDATGTPVSSQDLLAEGPLVVVFYRGGWCPYCNLVLGGLQARLDEFAAHGATLVAVSPQLPDASLSTAEKHALSFPVLSDVGNAYARELGLVHGLGADVQALYEQWGFDLAGRNDGHDDELPLPATYVVAPHGTVAWRFVDADYKRRAEPDDVLAALAALDT